ncbi:Clb1p [Saccharomyces cerevisiae YJM1248]|jgi:ATP-dependent Zn protease
MVTI